MIHRKVIISRKLLVLIIILVLCMEYGNYFVFSSGDEVIIRCIQSEREALLTFKKDFIDNGNFLRSWGNEDDKKDCCKWERVGCSDTTNHVIVLQLDFASLQPVGNNNISSALLDLHHLELLDLSGNDFGGNEIPEFIGSMKQLQHLYLHYSNFSGMIPPQLGNLTNLRTLLLFRNNLRSENLDWLSHLSLLSRLDLSNSNLSDTNWMRHILKLHSLEELSLVKSNIPDVLVTSCNNSSSLSLSFIDLSHNKLTSSAIDCLFRPDHLTELHLSGNKFKSLPASLGEFSRLEVLDVSSNSMQGTITESNLTKLHSLKELDLSFNSLTIRISSGWTPPFQLDSLLLVGSSNMGPHFPTWIQTQSTVKVLDLSGSGISGEVPNWVWSSSPALQRLNLSHNHLSGTIPHLNSSELIYIDVSFNNFSGHIPLLHPHISFIQLSQNMFSGLISSLCTTVLVDLFLLDLSSNQLAGEIPKCWENMSGLTFLNLANNKFSGEIPHTLGSLSSLQVLHLRNNNLSGELPSTLKNCASLQLMDIGGNMLTGNIPSWIGASSQVMTYIILNENRFYGSIPPEICNLTQIQVLDLSRNNLSGHIPQCFNNFTTMLDKGSTNVFFDTESTYIFYALVQWKGRSEAEYRKNLPLLKLIDLSSNKLVGNIPETFSSLKGLISLNLSRNSLTGNINPDIGQMEVLEVLDLSSNQLSGTIPISMAQLDFLAVLDLAKNNLSGEIPSSTQLQRFDASAYAGNPELCGPPLVSCPHTNDQGKRNNKEMKDDEDDGGFILTRISFWKEVGISIVFGFIVGFWGLVGSLLIKRSWRIAYYNFWGRVGNWFYVTAIVFFFRKA
ncbi:hypothetical protein ABFX02_13G018200 [Erythranthe guttata]